MDWGVTAVTVGTLGALAGASVWFNGRIDGTPAMRRPDGLTAVWVVIGVTYTLAGAGVLVGVWWPVLVHVAQVGAWAAALGVTTITAAAFAASGAPMVWGDMRRAYGLRTVGAAIAAARDELRGAARGE